jgi:DNA polymerase III subunit epsilon
MNIPLTRPLVFFDLETTGTDLVKDRVVQISVLKVFPDRSEESRTRLINPCIPIPLDASAIHGITDDDVKGQARFADIARSLYEFLSNSDFAGYNSNYFDVPFLVEEFARCGIIFPQEGARLIDVCTIFKRKEERSLTAAYKFYCGKAMVNAHDAEADVRATKEVFEGQLERYGDIAAWSLDQLHEYCNRDVIVDYARKLTRNDTGEIIFNFGKHKGQTVCSQPEYAQWMVENDFPEGTKMILREILSLQQA